ncbi:MAG: serine/threonine protein kinase, partial [Acidobacteria bacterium]|nr:serine/threonine protein kinase [Acidobacteriota bacterium]
IKPANVMLGPHGMVKITDFGIARAGEVMTMTGQVVGTPNYMSPEQVLGKTIDGRSDLFSVGVMLYEMITGERPFEGQSITTIMYKIVHETPIPPRKLDSSIHPGLSAVIEKSLAKSPEERYQTGAELTRALENYQSVQPPRSGPFDVATQEIAVPAELRASGPTVAAGIPSVALPPRHEDKPASRFEFLRSRRKRLVAVAFALSVIFLARSKRHDSDDQKPAAQENTSTAVSSPAPPPAVPEKPEAASPDTGSESESTSPAVPALNRRENANDNKQTALLSVNSSPPGAQIEVDGNSSGKTTPAQLQLPRGQHSVSVRLNGFMPASASFRVKGGEEIEYSPQLSVAMPNIAIPNVGMPDLSKLQELGKAGQRQGAFWQKWAAQQQNAGPQLVITSSPLGARVIVDGKDTEQTTPATISVQPGTYHVRLELDGFEPVEHDVKVKEHRPGVWNPMLKHGKSQE